MGTQLAIVEGLASRQPNLPANPEAEAFDFSGLRVFNTVPQHHHDVVALRRLVVVFDTSLHRYEGILEGAFYVREGQRPTSALHWETWLRGEVEAFQRDRRHCRPHSPLSITREVVRAVRCHRKDRGNNDRGWRLASGFTDGPYYDWAFGLDVIGKVVGIYAPGAGGAA